MSVDATRATWEIRGLAPLAKLVLLKLADHADGEGCAWPSIGRIADDTGLSRSTVCRHLDALESSGHLRRKRGGPKGRTSTRYHIKWSGRETSSGGELVRESVTSSPTRGPQVVPQPNPNHHTTTRNHQEGVTEFLEQVWKATTATSRNRSSRKQLKDAWKRLRPKPEQSEVLRVLRLWVASEEWKRDGGQYAPAVHRWIRDRRWESEPETARAAGGKAQWEDMLR